MRHRSSEYMYWAKECSRAPFNLATSGVGPYPIEELPFDLREMQINGPSRYGWEPLQHAIAQKSGVEPDCVVTAAGTSMANHLAMAALLDQGDEVLIEHPTYELLLSTALYLTPNVKRFSRFEESGFTLDPAEVERAISERTRLIVLTNLHNPSSTLASEQQLREVGEIAAAIGARVLVDEVYLDAVYENTPQSAIHYGPQFVTTSSLTKVYGLSGLRCGWVLAEPSLAREMWRLNDLFGVVPAFPAEQLSVAAFANLQTIRERSRRILEADRRVLAQFLHENPDVSAPQTKWGTTSFLRLPRCDVTLFVDYLRETYETSVVPGRFFEMHNHFRVGMGVDSAMFAEGLRRVGLAMRKEER